MDGDDVASYPSAAQLGEPTSSGRCGQLVMRSDSGD